jgi:exopolysaccharide production protein ExoZ
VPSSNSKDTYNVVQALRFIAAFMVVITHATFYTKERLDPNSYFWPDGASGVGLFFVISGFVMVVSSRSLSGTMDGWKTFALKRVVRIVPMYWIATTLKLLTLVFASTAVKHAELNPLNIFCSYFFIPTTNVEGHIEPLLGVGWTLVFEMFFYAVFAVALLVRRIDYFYIVGSVLAVCALGSLIRNESWSAVRFYLDPIVLNFLLGMIIGRWALTRATIPISVAILTVVLGFTLLLIPETHLKRNVIVSLVSSSVVVWGVVALESRFGQYVPKLVLFLGSASYTIYLFHSLIAPAVPEILKWLQIGSATVSVIGSVIVATAASSIVYLVLEKPITGVLTKLVFPNRKQLATSREQSASIKAQNVRL